MHELGITRNLVAIVADAAQGRRVRRVLLEIGERSAILPDAVRFCYDVVSQGTALQGSALEILMVAPGWHCSACGVVHHTDAAHCGHCGHGPLRQRSGDELNIKAMEVETCA